MFVFMEKLLQETQLRWDLTGLLQIFFSNLQHCSEISLYMNGNRGFKIQKYRPNLFEWIFYEQPA